MSAEARVCAAAIARWVAWFTLCFALAAAEHGAEAACNLIPQTTKVFEGAVGSMNRPFAAPGEPVDLRVRPCDTASAGLNASDLVTVVFTPPSGVKHAVVLTGAPTCAAVTPLLAACAAQLGSSGAATCVPSASSALQVIDDGSGRRLRFNFPSASVCSGGSDDQMFCGSDAECPGGACELDSTHTRTLSGPATIVVTPSNSPSLPCDLATTRCAARTGGHCNVTTSQACTPATQSTTCPSGESCLLDVTACLDDFFATDGSCATRTAQGTFNHFTALPVPNDFSSDCFTNPSVCTATATEMRVTTDSDGNVLMPMNWQGILVPSSIPVPRLLRAAIAPLVPLQLPGTSFVSSLTPEGGPLAPIFVPQFDPGAPTGVLNLFGSADAPYTILRIARRSQTFQQCSNSGFNAGLPCNGPDDCPGACIGGSTPNARCVVDGDCAGGGTCGPPGTCGQTACFGGSKNGQPCNGDANCPGGECGPALFNVASFGTAGGTGPLVIARSGPPGICEDSVGVCSSTCEPVTCNGSCTTGQCVQFAFTAEDPVNLQSLATNTQDVFAFSVEESVDGVDRNGDGDALDSVVTMRDRTTGTTQPLGAPSGCGTFVPATPAGRALVDLHESGQKFPAVSTEGDIVAFLEAEEAENGCDENGDFDHADAIVRVFKLGGTELTSATTVADSGLVIDKQNIEVSNGIVYYRHSEGGQSASQIDRASLATDGSQPDADCSGGNGSPSLSADGRFVGFSSFATTLLGPGGDTNGLSDAFVHDRCISNGGIVPGCTPSTEIVSLTADPTPLQGNGGSGAPRLSADGRFVVFGSSASNLVPGDTDGFGDIFLRDRCLSNGTVVADCTPTTERVSLRTDGTQATVDPGLGQGNYDRVVSDDGRFVVFGGNPNGMVAGSSSAIPNVFVRDRCLSKGVPVAGCTTRTIRVVVPVGGGEATGASGGFSISGNGRYIAFNSNDPNLVPCPPAPAVCDAGGTSDIFVRDLETNTTEWISVTPTGGAPNNQSYGASISSDGRFVAFQSTATDIAPGATNGFNHIFVRDRVTGRTESLSINSDGIEGNGDDFNPIISGNGRYVGWTAGASNYIHGDSNANFDAVVHDLVTGTTEGVSVDAMGGVGNCGSGSVGIAPAISDDGRTVAFSSDCTNFVAGDTNGFVDVYVHGPNAADAAADLTGDGDRGDTVLEQFDTTTSSTRVLCPANQVSIVAGAAAFLRPEAAGPTNNANCSGPTLTGPDLNGDGDSNDEVVHLAMPNGSVQNLGIAATLVSMSGSCSGGSNDGLACTSDAGCPGHAAACVPTWLAAAVPSSSGAAGEIQVHKVGDAPSVPWTATGRVADALQMVGNLAVFITPEAAQNKNLNGDGDKNDRVLQIYDAAAVQLTNVGDEAEEFVIGSDTPSCAQGPVVAFRTSEAAENQDLNGDGDKLDEVMQLYVPGVGVIHTGQAVTACNLAACDPRFPYRVSGSQVKFLTYEGDQSADLNGDGDQLDIVLQIYDVCARTTTVGGTIDPNAASTENPLPDTGKQTNTDSGASAAVVQGAHCVSGSTVLSVPATCTIDADCPTGATCTNASIVAAPAVVPQHDSVLLVPAPVNLTIGAHALQVSKTITVKVRNGDIKPAPEKPGHVIRLTASDGTCPVGTVQGLPDFDGKTPGDQDSVLLKGGATKSAKVSLLLPAAAFPTLHNSKAPYRCNLDLAVSTATAGNADPNPRNDTATVELNVVTLNGATSTATHESVIKSLAPVQLAIPASGSPSSKTVKAKLVNADSPAAEPLGHDIQLSTSDGDCPPGTVSVVPPATQTVRAGGSLTGKIAVNATASGFTSRNGKSPARCTATISAVTAVPGNLEPDPSNNTTNLIIDVNDKSDAPQ